MGLDSSEAVCFPGLQWWSSVVPGGGQGGDHAGRWLRGWSGVCNIDDVNLRGYLLSLSSSLSPPPLSLLLLFPFLLLSHLPSTPSPPLPSPSLLLPPLSFFHPLPSPLLPILLFLPLVPPSSSSSSSLCHLISWCNFRFSS